MVKLTAEQAAKYCRLRIGSLKTYIYTRQLPAHNPPGRKAIFFYKEELDRWLAIHKPA